MNLISPSSHLATYLTERKAKWALYSIVSCELGLHVQEIPSGQAELFTPRPRKVFIFNILLLHIIRNLTSVTCLFNKDYVICKY